MLAQARSWWRAVTGQSRLAGEMASEMDGHMERYAADLVAGGVDPGEARRRARIEFGSTAAAAEECREAVGLRWPDELARDLRYATRVLRKSPTFTAAAVATLALCIGANTAIFSVVDAVLLRPLPYPQHERLAAVSRFWKEKGASGDNTPQTGSTWEAVRDGATYLDSAAFSDGSKGVNFTAGGSVEYVQQQRVSAGFFRVLGIAPLIGREFSADEDRKGGPAVTLLSYALWKRIFHEDPTIVGQAVTLRGEPYTVLGVLPASFRSTAPADLWTPLRPIANGEGGGSNYHIVSRLRPGATWAQADAQIEAVGAPVLPKSLDKVRLRLISFQRGLTSDVRKPLLMLWAAVGLVLLIGCVNIAGLLLARAAGRTREMATRMALGSGRAALIRQMLAESVLVGLCGGAAGAALGWLGVKGLKVLAQDSLNVWQTVDLNWRVLAATGCASIAAGILFGLYPALVASRLEIRAALGEAGRGVAGARNPWPRRLLVASEVALSVVLLVGAGLLIRTFAHLQGLNPGFDAHGVISASLSLQDARYATSQSVNRLFDQSLSRIRELPGVESAAVTLSLPYESTLNTGLRRLDGVHADAAKEYQITNFLYVTPEYFRVLRIPLLRGRVLTSADAGATAPVVMVSEAFVKMYLRDDQPLGRHLDLGFGDRREIVGVAGDVQQKSGWGEEYGPVAPVPAVYVPAAQTDDKFLQLVHGWFSPSWIVRTAGPPEGVIAGMQRALEAVDPRLPFAGFHSMEDVRYRALAQERFQAALLGALAGLAMLLAAVGIYGLIASSVAERTRELGIRLALGATVPQAMRAVALPGVVLALAGVAAGSVLAGFASRILGHVVWGVRPGDPLTFVAVGVGLLAVAAAASFLPALRVTRLNPAETLRQE